MVVPESLKRSHRGRKNHPMVHPCLRWPHRQRGCPGGLKESNGLILCDDTGPYAHGRALLT